MRARIDSILIGILIGALGAWQVLAGLGVIKMNVSEWKGPAQVVAGLMFIFGGAWSFFHGTLGPGGQDLPLYPWIQYFMVLPILAGLVFIFLWEGNESGGFAARTPPAPQFIETILLWFRLQTSQEG